MIFVLSTVWSLLLRNRYRPTLIRGIAISCSRWRRCSRPSRSAPCCVDARRCRRRRVRHVDGAPVSDRSASPGYGRGGRSDRRRDTLGRRTEHAVGHWCASACANTPSCPRAFAGRVQVADVAAAARARGAGRRSWPCASVATLTCRSALLARDDSAIAGLADVRGKRIAWVDRSPRPATCSRIRLIGAGLIETRLRGEHFTRRRLAARAVIEGDADVRLLRGRGRV